jgi:hypothetical protein
VGLELHGQHNFGFSGCVRYGHYAAARVMIGKFGMWELDIVTDLFANKFTT